MSSSPYVTGTSAPAADVRQVAQKFGYQLKNNGRRLSACPNCGPTTAVQVTSDFFKCHRCDAGGRAHSFVAYHLYSVPWGQLSPDQKRKARAQVHGLGGPVAPALPFPGKSTKPRWLRADALWSTFERSAATPNAEALQWLTDRLAGDATLAQQLLQKQPAIVAAPALRDPLRRWWGQDYAVAAPLYVWEGPQKGAVADFKPRWCGQGPAPRDLKEPNLSSKKTRASGLIRFFGAPETIHWGTRTIIVLEGGADYMVGQALRHSGRLGDDVAIVALPGAGQAAALGKALAAHLLKLTQRYQGASEGKDPWRVIIATDADTAGHDASDAIHTQLRTHGAHVVMHRTPWNNGDDLSDRVADAGVDAAAAELLAAPPYQPSPLSRVPTLYRDADHDVSLDEAGAVLEATLAQLVTTAKTKKSRHVLAVPPGAGKTTAALNLVIQRAQRRGGIPPLIIALPSWASVREKQDQLDEMAAVAGVRVVADELVGVNEGCRDGTFNGFPVLAKTAYEKAGHPQGWRRDVCLKCPLRPTCRAHHVPTKSADVIFTVHAMLTRLKPEDYKSFVVVTDEAAEPVQLARFEVDHLRAPDDATMGSVWESEQLDAVDRLDAWRELRDLVSDVIAGTERERHAKLLTGKALGGALLDAAYKRGGENAARTLRHSVGTAASVDPKDLPAPDTHQLLSTGRADSRILVRRDLPQLYQCLSDLLEGVQLEPGSPRVHLIVPLAGAVAGREFAFEIRRPTPLPDGLGAVALDATATLTPHLHEAYLGGPVEVTRIAVRPDAGARIVRVFLKQKGLSRSRLMPMGSPGREALQRLTRLVRQAAVHAKAFAGADYKVKRAALLTYKPLVNVLERPSGGGPLKEWQNAVARFGRQVQSGYFGGQARASNAFEGCDLLVTLGDPWPNLGARRATLEALGLDDETINEALLGEVDAELCQAHGRSRAERRDGVTVQVHIGQQMPASWRGLPVHLVEASRPEEGRPTGAGAVAFEVALTELAEQLKVLTPRLVSRLLDSSATSDTNPSISLLADWDSTHDSRVLSDVLLGVAGVHRVALPPETTRRRVLRRVLGELGWRCVDKVWLAPQVSDEEGLQLLAYLQALTKGVVARPPLVAAERHWWWLVIALDDFWDRLVAEVANDNRPDASFTESEDSETLLANVITLAGRWRPPERI